MRKVDGRVLLALAAFCLTGWRWDSLAEDVADTDTAPEIVCPNAGTWLFAADTMLVDGTPSGMGGGVDLPWVKTGDCPKTVKIELNALKAKGDVELEWQGSEFDPAVETFLEDYLAELSPTTVPTVEQANEAIATKNRVKAMKEDIRDSFKADEPAVAYYAGHLPHEARIFWIQAVYGPGSMRSVVGFAGIQEGPSPAPAHYQMHVWEYWKSDKATEKELEKAKEAVAYQVRSEQFDDQLRMALGLLSQIGVQ